MRFRGEVRWLYLPLTLLKCVRIGEKADCPHTIQTVLLLRNPSEAVLVLVVDCPNLNRPHAIIPPLHPSSITLAALILFAPSPHP